MLTQERKSRKRNSTKKPKLLLLVISIVLVIVMALSACQSGTAQTPSNPDHGTGDVGGSVQKPDDTEQPDGSGGSGNTDISGDTGGNGDSDDKGDTGDNGDSSDKGDSGDTGDSSDTGDNGDSGGGDLPGATAELEIHFLMLGNGYAGDCTLLKTGNTEVLIDAGSRNASASTLVPKIKSYCTDGILEYVIVTHADQDHISAFVGSNSNFSDGIFANFKCGTIIDFALSSKSTKVYNNYKICRDKEVSQDGAKHYTALQCWNQTDGAQREYTLAEGIKFEILYQKFYEQTTSDENNYSVCTLFTQNEYHYLFTGDLEAAGEASLIEKNNLPKCKLFKAGHHGSKTSSNDNLLRVIQPENVCIPCNAGSTEYTDNKNGTFPTQDTLNRIARYTKNIYVPIYSPSGDSKDVALLNGEITVRSNGIDFSIHGSNNDTILKETEWFKSNRTWPSYGVQ